MDRASDDNGSSIGSRRHFEASSDDAAASSHPRRPQEEIRRTRSKKDARATSEKDASNRQTNPPPPTPPAQARVRSRQSSESCQHSEGLSRPLLVTSSSVPNGPPPVLPNAPRDSSDNFECANDATVLSVRNRVCASANSLSGSQAESCPGSSQGLAAAASLPPQRGPPSNPTTLRSPRTTRRHQRRHSDMAGAPHTSLELDSPERQRPPRVRCDPSASASAPPPPPARPRPHPPSGVVGGPPPGNRGGADASPEPVVVVAPSPCALRVAPRAFPAASAAGAAAPPRRVPDADAGGGGADGAGRGVDSPAADDGGGEPAAPAGPDRTTTAAPRPAEGSAAPSPAPPPRRRRRRSGGGGGGGRSSFLDRLEDRAAAATASSSPSSSSALDPRVPRRWRAALCVSLYVILMTLNAEESGHFRRMGEGRGAARGGTAGGGGGGGGARRRGEVGREVAFGRQHGREVAFPPSPLDDGDRRSGARGALRGAAASSTTTTTREAEKGGGGAAGNEAAGPRVPPDAAREVPEGKRSGGGRRKRRRPAMAHARTAAQAGRMPLYGAPDEPALPNADPPPPRRRSPDEVERFVLKDDEIPSYGGERGGVDLLGGDAFASSPGDDGGSSSSSGGGGARGPRRKTKGRLALLALGFLSWLALTALVLDAGCREVRRRFLYVRQRNLRARWETRRSR